MGHSDSIAQKKQRGRRPGNESKPGNPKGIATFSVHLLLDGAADKSQNVPELLQFVASTSSIRLGRRKAPTTPSQRLSGCRILM